MSLEILVDKLQKSLINYDILLPYGNGERELFFLQKSSVNELSTYLIFKRYHREQ